MGATYLDLAMPTSPYTPADLADPYRFAQRRRELIAGLGEAKVDDFLDAVAAQADHRGPVFIQVDGDRFVLSQQKGSLCIETSPGHLLEPSLLAKPVSPESMRTLREAVALGEARVLKRINVGFDGHPGCVLHEPRGVFEPFSLPASADEGPVFS